MTKDTTAGMDTHLDQEVTTLAMATLIERTDGVKFHLTSSSEDITIDIGDGDGEQTYLASEGISRTNIQSDAELNVDNLDIIGVFSNNVLKETELRRGLFDFADFKIFVFNHQDTTDGIIKIFRGELGEVTVTKQNFFNVQVRSMVQVFSKQTGELYSKDCRADLGDIRCTVPVYPVILPASTALTVGEFYRIPDTPNPDDCSQVIMNFEGVDTATTGVGFDNIGTDGSQPTINGTSQIDTAQIPAGGTSTSSLLLDGNSDYLSWTDRAAWVLGANPVTISAHFRLNATGVDHTIISQYNSVSNQRSWFIRVDTGDKLNFRVYEPGGSVIDVELFGTTTLNTINDYHVAVVRKVDGDWVMFLDGAIEDGPDTPTGDPHDGTEDLRIGALESSGSPALFHNGWIDSVELLIGFARWEAPFTPPTGNLSAAAQTLIWEDFGDRIYEVTTAGTTLSCPQTPDTVISNTHNQGTAILTANHSWMRFAEVSAVGSNARRDFTVDELNPASGETVGANRTPSALGFPDDWFNGGGAFFESGNNAGRVVEVRDFIAQIKYLLDTSDAGPTDPGGVWSDDADAFVDDTNEATTTTSGSSASNYLEGEGTAAPGSGIAITRVRLSVEAAESGADAVLGVRVTTDGAAETLLDTTQALTTTSTAYEFDLTIPTGGWDYAKLQALEIRFWRDSGSATLEVARSFVEISQILELFSNMPFDVVVGDKLRIFPGCDKTNPICISKFNNGINFVGEPYVPGEDVLGQYPDAR